MTGRLIDADKLKNDIVKWLNPNSYIEEPRMVEVDDIAVSVIMEIEKQPTVYDVDEIAKRLEKYLFEKYCIEGDLKIDEIVKGGGTDESDRWR